MKNDNNMKMNAQHKCTNVRIILLCIYGDKMTTPLAKKICFIVTESAQKSVQMYEIISRSGRYGKFFV